MTYILPLDMVWGPTMPVPLRCPHPESDGCGLGLGPVPTVASVPVILALSASILVACGRNPVWCGPMMNALWSGPTTLGLVRLIFRDRNLVHPRGLSPISLVGSVSLACAKGRGWAYQLPHLSRVNLRDHPKCEVDAPMVPMGWQ